MNLQTNISEPLWSAVSGPYQSENYKHAILEAIHLLTSEVRTRAGIDGDGVALVGQAFGGETPRLPINSLQTESERNIQKGVEHLLRGLYLAVRNPRSHDPVLDSRQDAEAIIHFVDYLLRIINASKEAFTIESFLTKVADSEFVEVERYSELLVKEIPVNRRGDALIALYENRLTLDVKRRRHLIRHLLTLLSETQLEQYLAIVSNQFRIISEFAEIQTSILMLTPEIWPRIHELARWRIETKLIKEIRIGEVQSYSTASGALATWAKEFIKYFTRRSDVAQVLIAKLTDTNENNRHYVAKFFLPYFPEIFVSEGEIRKAVRTIATQVQKGDLNVRRALLSSINQFPNEWQSQLTQSLADLTDYENPAMHLEDGTPFLQAIRAQEEDDIPF